MDAPPFIVLFNWFYSLSMNSSPSLHSASTTVPYTALWEINSTSINPLSPYSGFLIILVLVPYSHPRQLPISVSTTHWVSHSSGRSNTHTMSTMFITFLSSSFTHYCSWTSTHTHHMLAICLSSIVSSPHKQRWHKIDNGAVWRLLWSCGNILCSMAASYKTPFLLFKCLHLLYDIKILGRVTLTNFLLAPPIWNDFAY